MRSALPCLLLAVLPCACAGPDLSPGFASLERGAGDEALAFFEGAVDRAESTPEARPRRWRAWLGYGLAQIDVALQQQDDRDLWTDVAESAREAEVALERARRGRGSEAEAERLEAGLATARAVGEWHKVLVAPYDGTPAPLPGEVLARVEPYAGVLPEAARLTANILFSLERFERGLRVLGDALVRWPANARLHEMVRQWREAAGDPLGLAARLAEIDAGEDVRLRATLATTRGFLMLAQGSATYFENAGEDEAWKADLPRAADEYEAAAELFVACAEGDARLARDQCDLWRGEALVNAGWCHYNLEELEAAEAAFAAALEAVPGLEGAVTGLDYVGDAWYQRDIALARDYFGRIARRFETNADWWNNYAFFCRETGMYEESYAAYERCIAIEPDDARRVNDTALILLYHLDRDLDHAEELFHRAWQLGKEACENPFIDQEAYDQNFLAYTDAMHNLGLLHLRRGDLDEAERIVDELLELSPGRVDTRGLRLQIEQAREQEEAS